MINKELKQNVRLLKFDELKDFLDKRDGKLLRTRRIAKNLWLNGIDNFDSMTDIPKSSIELLKQHFYIRKITLVSQQKSEDGTTKFAFRLQDDSLVEGVLIPSGKRLTACISSQAGCKFGCSFCATGKLGFKRHLDADEIYDQVAFIRKFGMDNLGMQLSNIVFMGMGEPLENYKNVMLAVHWLQNSDGFNLSPRIITISTVGLADQIIQLANEGFRGNLAVSLHSAVAKTRSQLMPVNRAYSLDELQESVKYFTKKTGNPATFEYLLLSGINDTKEAADALINYCKDYHCKVNLIEFNPNDQEIFNASKPEDRDFFFKYLAKNKVIVSVRHSKGKDIDAACGQLANKLLKR
jgi:23S rRNA (adenine2503-C2)-methyltransferase